MNIKSKKFITVFLTLVFAATVFTMTAFAESNTSVPVDPPSQEPTSSVIIEEPSQPESESQEEPSKPDESSVSDTSSEPGDISQPQSSQAESTGPDNSELPVTSSKPVVNHYVDTHTNQVEQRASHAAQTISDPDVLSSQDWGELLSSGESASSGETVQAGGTVSNEPESPSGIGGVSWLLILGVVLIVLALCGIALFIYLQFFFQEHPKKLKFAPAGNVQKQEEPAAFEDISSYSDDEQHPSDPVSDETRIFTDIQSSSHKSVKAPEPVKSASPAKNYPAAKPHPGKKPVKSDLDETVPIPQGISGRSNPASPKSQAKPVKESDFDWDKFFNGEK